MIQLLTRQTWSSYQLLDSGRGQKLENVGGRIIVRGEPKAWWERTLEEKCWGKAIATHIDSGKWSWKQTLEEAWTVRYEQLTLELRMHAGSKHVGIFPEQIPHWQWLAKKVRRDTKVLNIFGYTGVASLVAAAHGATVTHVDASKPTLAWAKKNQQLSDLSAAPIRWICDDARKFIQREIKRGNRYDIILLDPPSFGRGPTGEIWKAERDLFPFLQACAKLLSDHPIGIILTLYALDASSLMIKNLFDDAIVRTLGGTLTVGELALPHVGSEQRYLPLSLFGRWEADNEPPHR